EPDLGSHGARPSRGSTARKRTSSAADSFASRRQRSTSETAHLVSADARTKASPSRRPSRRADTAPTIHIPSTGSARERGRRLPGFRLPGPYAPRVHATLPAYDDPIGAHHFLAY